MTKAKLTRQKLGVWKRENIAAASSFLRRCIGARGYYLFSGAFSDEQRAVSAGTRMHYVGERSNTHQMFLRRSIHRIEKGLSSSPMRETFAGDYIVRTVGTYFSLSQPTGALKSEVDEGEIRWAGDVLDQFFSATASSNHPEILKARAIWSRSEVCDERLVPFAHSRLSGSAESFEGLARLSSHRRSVRLFDQRPVPRPTVEQAVTVGLQAPSACNRQSLRVVLVDDPELREKVASVPMGTAGFASQIPLIAVVIGQHRGYEHERDRHAVYVDGGLFSMGFVLALEGLGLNSCCINWPDLREKHRQMETLVSLAEDERVVMLIAIGYGKQSQLVPRSKKRDVKAVAQWL
ncbi:nitroreductase family protein [Williamsia limnetica]|nr:nitroreductase family protein [Williamsia limnetica]